MDFGFVVSEGVAPRLVYLSPSGKVNAWLYRFFVISYSTPKASHTLGRDNVPTFHQHRAIKP